MYDYVKDKAFLKRAHGVCANLVNQLVQLLGKYGIEAEQSLVGSGGRNMVTQNANEPIDFDYNLIIWDAPDIMDCRYLKDTVKKAFDYILDKNGLSACDDSTSVLTSKKFQFTKGNQTEFSIDIAIVRIDDNGCWHRLIHKKTGNAYFDQYYWNQTPHSQGLYEKEKYLKGLPGGWEEVRSTYLNKKNMYLTRQDYNHSSFICYIEAVNEIYYKYNRNVGYYRNVGGFYSIFNL